MTATNLPEVDQQKINEAIYHFAMFIRCLVEAAGGQQNEREPAAYRLKDAALYLACRKRTLRRLRALGDLEPIETPDGPRWLKSDLDAYVAQCEASSRVDDAVDESEDVVERELVGA